MKQVYAFVQKDSRVNEFASKFKNGKFDDLEKKHRKESSKEKVDAKCDTTCFSLCLSPTVSVMSNDLLRSGLFSSARRAEASAKTLVHEMPIATIGMTKISLTGYVLDQVDYEVYVNRH